MDDKLKFVIEQLKGRHGELTVIANRTGLHRRTLSRIADEVTTPTLDTLNALYDDLKKKRKSGK